MDFNFTTIISMVGGSLAIIGLAWKGLIKPNLNDEFVTKKDCVIVQKKGAGEDDKRDVKLERLENKVEIVSSDLKAVGINVEWIKGALERLEK